MSDKHFSQVQLLCGFNGADGATAFTDESTAARAATFVANAQLDTAQFKYGTASLLLDGTGDYVSFADAAAFTLGTSDFTIEAWVRFSSLPATTQEFLTHYTATGEQRAWIFGYAGGSGQIRFSYSTAGTSATLISVVGAWTPEIGRWHHVAACRIGSTLRLFADGVLIVSHNIASASIFNTTAPVRVGAGSFAALDNFLFGWIDEARITVGAGRYATDFIPAQGPFSRAKRTGVIAGARQPTIGVYR